MKIHKRIKSTIIIGLVVMMLLAVTSSTLASDGVVPESNFPTQGQTPDVPDSISTIMNLDLQLPQGSRIDYLRILYYDTSPNSSRAWVTIYDGEGNYIDLIGVSSTGDTGYGYVVSDYVGHVVDNALNAYVLNWRPYQLGYSMQLCGLRVAYRLPDGGGGWSNFFYKFVTGSTLRPRNSEQTWASSGHGGCLLATYPTYLPLSLK